MEMMMMMMMMMRVGIFIKVTLVVAVAIFIRGTEGAVGLPPESKKLVRQYYKKLNTCENAEAYVKHQVNIYWNQDHTLAAKLLKLLYADCMLNGCDASILLDAPNTEKTAPLINAGGLEAAFRVIDKIKTVLESRCPAVVSCSDILNLATRDALHLAGAPSYPVLLGRRDGMESKAAWVDLLPSPSISWQACLAYFQSKGLDVQDFATLLGAHTMGKTHCNYIWDRLYNFSSTSKPDPTMDRSLLRQLRLQCPNALKNNNQTSLFLTAPAYRFTNAYYNNVLSHQSVLGVDQQLLYNYDTYQLTLEYAASFEQFRRGFALSITRMGLLNVLTGTKGEIRHFTNKNNPYLN